MLPLSLSTSKHKSGISNPHWIKVEASVYFSSHLWTTTKSIVDECEFSPRISTCFMRSTFKVNCASGVDNVTVLSFGVASLGFGCVDKERSKQESNIFEVISTERRSDGVDVFQFQPPWPCQSFDVIILSKIEEFVCILGCEAHSSAVPSEMCTPIRKDLPVFRK